MAAAASDAEIARRESFGKRLHFDMDIFKMASGLCLRRVQGRKAEENEVGSRIQAPASIAMSGAQA